MAVEVGDAVLKFLGDSSNLDTKFAEVGPNAQKAFEPAAVAAEDAGERMSFSMREAKGEIALLGEEVGIRLPRHVRGFIAELPGVGKALSAAFSATAIIFVAQALVQLSEKLSNALVEFVYAKSVMEESTKSVVDLNTELVSLGKEYDELKKKADDYGKSALQLATQNKGEVKESITELNKEMRQEEDQFKTLIATENAHTKSVLTTTQAWKEYRSGNIGALQALKGWLTGIDTSILKHKEHDEVENKLLLTHQKLKVAQQELRVATNGVSTAQAELDKKGAALQDSIDKSAAEINKLTQAFNHHKAVASDVEIITPAQINNILKGIAAAHQFNIVLKSDLVQGYMDAKKALDDWSNSGLKDELVQKQLTQQVKEAKLALDNYGHSVDTFKVKSHGLWKEFKQDAKDGATALDHTKQIGVTAFDDMTKGFEQAIAATLLSSESFGDAMKKVTANALASIASQALVKALFYTAEGFAMEAGFMPGQAAEYFQAAGIMAAVGAAAGVAAHAMSGSGGGGSGSRNTSQGFTTASNTTSSAVAVPHMAEGGLITRPTLVMAGEAGREAIVPLDNPQAKQAMGSAGVGGGHTVNVHVDGMISPDNLAKVCQKISRGVQKGTLQLHASNSMRVTKRSA